MMAEASGSAMQDGAGENGRRMLPRNQVSLCLDTPEMQRADIPGIVRLPMNLMEGVRSAC